MTKTQFLHCLEYLLKADKKIDTAYILSILFPELNAPSRIPTKFTQATAMFTQRYYVNLPGTANGNMALSFFPMDTAFRSLFITGTGFGTWASSDVYTGNPNSAAVFGYFAGGEADNSYIPDKYSHVRLIGASIRVQYTGNVQQEQGFITASTVMDAQPGSISSAIINDGYNVVRARLREGVRFIWLPKKESDIDLWETNFKITHNEGTNDIDVNSAFWNDNADQYGVAVTPLNQNHELTVKMKTATQGVYEARMAGGSNDMDYFSTFIGQGQGMSRDNTPDQVMMEFWGIPISTSCLRVDVERHFEGIPEHDIRNIVSTAKASPNEQAIALVRKFTEIKSVQGQTMETFPMIQRQVQEQIHESDAWLDKIQGYQWSTPDWYQQKNDKMEDMEWLFDSNGTGTGTSDQPGMIGGDQYRGRISQGYETFQDPNARIM